MKKSLFKPAVCLLLLCGMVFSMCACSSVELLKKSHFSPEYKAFVKNMQKNLPVSVAFEQYLKGEGFREEKLIVDTDQGRIRDLVEALAAVKIVQEVETASNFAVRHYTFTDENGATFTFEFFGEYLKVEDRFYQTENSRSFVSIRLHEKKSGEILAALDEAYDGKGEFAGKRYISCRELEQKGAQLSVANLAEYELSDEALITAPTSHDDFKTLERVSAAAFFANYEAVKGQDNANYIFHLKVERGVIVSLEFDAELSARKAFE